jgi:uncharacterized protein YuzE
MDGRLTFHYDHVGDILYINTREPYAGQVSREIDDGIIVRLRPDTNIVESIEILFYSRRLEDTNEFTIPVLAEMRLAA